MTNPLHTKKTFPLLLAVSLSLAGFNTTVAQTVGSPLSTAQDAVAESLTAAFDRYPHRQEKLFVHVDKSLYLAGEIVWFKIYDVDAGDNTPLSISGIAYVELVDKDQKAILQQKIEVNKGTGDGSLRIPSSIPSGRYLFRAYTGWMKNFSPDFYYRQELTIINTLANEPSVDSAHRADAHIQFFPEGGNLVNGLPSTIAFKATAPSCSGVIIDQNKDTVARFNSHRFAMGHFQFTPARGNTYTALVTTPSGTITEKLPTAYDDGLVMHLEDIDGRHLQVTVRSSSTPADPTLYLFVHTRHRIRSVQASRLTNNQTTFTVDKDSLDDGISHITLFTAARIPVCERLYCKQPEKQLHIDVNTRPSAATRTRLDVDLATADPSGRPMPADLSLSVFLTDSLEPLPGENIVSYLLLRSDLQGKIESPQSYFADKDPATIEALDDLMLTQGWSRFRWEDMLREKKPVFEFLPESNGPVIHARLIDKTTGKPPSPRIGYLTVPGRDFKLATAMSHEDGSLFFHVDRFYGNHEIIIQTNTTVDSNYRIDVTNPFSDRFAPQPEASSAAASDAPAVFSSTPEWKDQLLNRSIGVQAENAYRLGEKNRFIAAPARDTTSFYGAADRQYKLDDYTRFVTMDEVIREFVENVRVRQQSGKTIFRVRNILFNLFFEDDPLLLIDGLPVFNGAKMIDINPLKIQKIDVVSHRYFLGPSITDGIVSFRSYNGDLGGYQLDPSAVVVQYNGLQEHREFYAPAYETEAQTQSPLPDLRNQLLWRPDIVTDSAGSQRLSLYTSDMTGTFAIVVQGLTADGSMGYSIKKFTVDHAPAADPHR